MPVNTKIILGGAALLGYLFSSKGGTKKSTSTPSSKDDPSAEDTKNTGKGDIGEPAGPNGCLEGLIIKNGICSKADLPKTDPKDKVPPKDNGTGHNGLPTAASMYISPDCKIVKFGDKTGNAWWAKLGKPSAQQWINSGYDNPLMIAWEMLRKNACFSDFPIQKNYDTRSELEYERIFWIIKKREVWNLLTSVKNRIDKQFYDGRSVVEIDPVTGKITYGKKFNILFFWDDFRPLTVVALDTEEKDKGTLFKNSGIKNPAFDPNSGAYDWTVSVWIMWILFSNMTATQFDKHFDSITNWEKNEIFKYVNDAIGDILDEGLDFEFNPEGN